jgi:hypothetical protein
LKEGIPYITLQRYIITLFVIINHNYNINGNFDISEKVIVYRKTCIAYQKNCTFKILIWADPYGEMTLIRNLKTGTGPDAGATNPDLVLLRGNITGCWLSHWLRYIEGLKRYLAALASVFNTLC